MTNEQILEELKAAMKANNEARVKSNEAMCHAINAVERADKEYERGMNDAWEIVKEILATKYYDLEKIFGANMLVNILKNNTPMEVKEKLDNYEKEKNKISVGDKVEIKWFKYSKTGIVISEEEPGYYFIFTDDNTLTKYNEISLKKTGEHVDLFEVLKLKRE